MRRPRDHDGTFVPLTCPIATCDGKLEFNEHWSRWECNGLIDPENDGLELQECTYSHQDGDYYEWWMWGETGTRTPAKPRVRVVPETGR